MWIPKSAMGFWTKQPLGRNGISSPFGEARLRRSSPAACSEGYFCRQRETGAHDDGWEEQGGVQFIMSVLLRQ
jgi:hypothetical protein